MKKHQLSLLLAVAAGLASSIMPIRARADTAFVGISGTNTIMQFTPDGIGSAFANTSQPHGLAFDRAGNLFVANPVANTIEKFSATGADLGVFANSGGASPYGLAFDSVGNLFVANAGANSIVKITPEGVGSVFVNSALNYPSGLAFDSAGNLYVANGNANAIRKFSPTGDDLGVFAGSGGVAPVDLAFDRAGNLYVANNGSGEIVKITPGGVGSVFANIGGSPFGLAFDSAGNLYVTYATFIEKFSPTGTDLGVFAGGLSSPAFLTFQPFLTNIVVTPANKTIGVGTNQQFIATGNYSNGGSRILTSGGDSWTTGAPISSPSYGLGGAFVGGKFYAISGFATTRVGVYDPTNNAWGNAAPLPELLQYFGTAVVDGKIYVVGGDTGGGGQRNTLYRYDPTLNSWTNLAPMPLGVRYNLAAAALNGKIYAVGGNDGSGNLLDRVEIYDPANNTWSTGTSLPAPRNVPLLGAINRKIYLAGGNDSAGAVTNGFVFDPAVNTWNPIAPMAVAQAGMTAVLGGKLYVIGGYAPDNRVQSYDPLANAWSTNYATLPTGRRQMALAADEASGRIFAASGYNSTYSFALEIFTPPGEVTWSSGSPFVASLSPTGLATGLSVGNSTITATAGIVSGNTTLTVVTQPAITNQPLNATVGPNGSVTLSVGATGGGLTYQWRLNGTNVPGANGPTLTLSNLDASQAGIYSVVVSNVAGSATSSAATLSLLNLNMFAGLTIVGQVGGTYQIDYRNDFNSTNWFNLTNVVLPSSPYLFIDTASPQHPQRFYRAVWLP